MMFFSFNSFSNALPGTGSQPCPPHGWQLAMRLALIQKPLKGPWILTASAAYVLQVGW